MLSRNSHNTNKGGKPHVHVEVQGYLEEEFARRMYVYNYRTFDKYGKEVVSLTVLTDRNPRYRPSRYEFKLNGFELVMKFPVVKLLDYERKEEELEGSENPFGLVTLAWLRSGLDLEKRYIKKKSLIRELIKLWQKRGWARKRLKRLFLFIDVTISLPEELERKLTEELREEVEDMREYIIPPMFKDEFEREFERGVQQGIKEGKREKLRALIELKYGEKGIELIPLVNKLEDVGVIDALSELVKLVDDYERYKRRFMELIKMEL